jgi:hypothetical protein
MELNSAWGVRCDDVEDDLEANGKVDVNETIKMTAAATTTKVTDDGDDGNATGGAL